MTKPDGILKALSLKEEPALSRALPRDFYARPTLSVAVDLLGQRLVRIWEGRRLAGRIMEVEAYIGTSDLASHARFGKTPRNASMFGPPGHAYVYSIYGVHHCLNVVTEAEEVPAAILIRALEPVEGIEIQQQLRGRHITLRDLTRGPGRLCQALAIDRSLDGYDLCASTASLTIEQDVTVAAKDVVTSPRVGVTGDSVARNAPWRFYARASVWTSAK